MAIRARTWGSIAIGIALGFAATRAYAGDPCIDDAKETLSDCKGDCQEGYQTDKDACINKDHACVEDCRAGRSNCVDATPLQEDLNACQDTLRAAKAKCRTDHAGDDGAIDACIDQAQVVAFLCRKTARQTSKPAINACRAGFRACVKACPPPANPTDVTDPRQCKLDAKTGYLACKSDCREAFQTQKDFCLHRDHACVEQCRADRDSCRQPVDDQLESDIAACDATRDTAVQNCKDLYADGDPNRDTCITNAQVAAFECRDQARENAKPGYDACAASFKSCATACPPAS